jgi:hypothetical protein
VYQNGRNGIWFNSYGESNNSHRNMFADNVIEDNGTKNTGYGLFVNADVKDITVRNNTIRDTGKKTQRCGVLISKGALNIKIIGNTMAGHVDGDVIRH